MSIAQAKRKRNGKKHMITKMINEIEELVVNKGSRTKLKYLRSSLDDTLKHAIVLHEELMLLLPEDDPQFTDQWIEELSLRVNTCFADIEQYFADRKDDTPSSLLSSQKRDDIQRWREQTQESISDMCGAFSRLNVDQSDPNELTTTTSITNLVSKTINAPGNGGVRSRPHEFMGDPASDSILITTENSKISQSFNDQVKTYLNPTMEEFIPMNPNKYITETYDPYDINPFHSTYTVSSTIPDLRSYRYTPEISKKSTLNKQDHYEQNDQVETAERSTKYIPPHHTNIMYSTIPHTNVISSTIPLEISKKSKNVQFETKPKTPSIPSQGHKSLDQWIDELDPNKLIIPDTTTSKNVQMELLIQQRLPRQELPTFSGEADKWVEFVSKFYDIVHKQPYLDSFQKRTYLMQHLKGEALRALDGFANDDQGYVNSLKKLKYMFGNRVYVAQSVIRRITKCKQVSDSDPKALASLYYEISSCLNTLIKMNYIGDIYSTDLLRQTLSKLPNYLQRKWSEYSFILRRTEEPNLYHLERWLQDRVMASRDPYLFNDKLCKVSNMHNQVPNVEKPKRQCVLCNKDHWLFSCETYKSKSNLDKLSFVKRKKLCFNCLSQRHSVKSCSSKKSCYIEGCKKRHHTSLHHALLKKAPDKPPNSDQISNQGNSTQTNNRTEQVNKTIGFVKGNSHVYLQVAPVRVENARGKHIDTFALLDAGSQCTLITKSLCKELELQGRRSCIDFGTIKDNTILRTKLVDLNITAIDGSYSTKLKGVYSLDDNDFNVPGQEVPITSESEWDYIRDLNLCDINSNQIQMLIGSNVPDVLISHEVRKARKGYPYAVKTLLGWTLLGVYDGNTVGAESTIVALTRNLGVLGESSEYDYHSFWETESFGTEVYNSKPRSIEDQRNLNILDKGTEFKNGHYVVPMLWKSNVNLPESQHLANRRLNQICRRFQSSPDFFKMYQKNVTGHLENGFAEKLSKEESEKRTDTTWYVPHHGVTNVNKPGKVRMVFDAAAQSSGQSLNSNLFSGPDLLNSLLGVLLRFRKHKIAVVADIEAMFHQVRLKESDTNAVRFLWKDNPKSEKPPDHYRMLVHIFGATDSPCAATYALKRAAMDQSDVFPMEVVEAVLRNFYVDDLLTSHSDVQKAKQVSESLITLLKNKGFNLTKFQSNDPSVLEDLPADKVAPSTGLNLDDKSTISRALGVQWDLKTDCFTYKVNADIDQAKCTKRSILKKTATIFDPLGLLTPFTLVAKLLIQELWREKVDWDDEVNDTVKKRWENWLQKLAQISSSIAVPRSLNIGGNEDIQLHIFCDASEQAFAAVAYVRVNNNGMITSHILMSKSRVAPLKRLTIPRLELQGAIIAVRMKETIVKEIDIAFSSIRFWTDSLLNLQYINNESKRYKVFVANRVAEIRNHSEPEQWYFVPGKINPVDISTRGEIKDDVALQRWFSGPEFLIHDESEWPRTELEPLSPTDKEIKKQKSVYKITCFTAAVQFERFSSWRRLIRTIAWVMVFLKPRQDQIDQKISTRKDLTVEEEKIGSQKTLKLIQMEVFNDEVTTNELNGKLSKLDPYLDTDGLIRVGGRLKRGNFPYAAKHQVILPKNHHAVELLVRYYHTQNHHIGTEHLISLLRQEFWIISVRVIVKRVIRQCIKCQKRRVKPSQIKMADLPPDRITVGAPTFFHTGVDFFGPIQVKVLRSKAKRWGCIFTCLVTRAVHLELSPSLESDDFINVLERFINRRGHPKMIRSDCGTNFKGATNELKKEIEKMDNLRIAKSLQRKEIEWRFNPPEAPHMGGVWERLVRSVKTTLSVMMSEGAVMHDFTLLTLLTEVEAILNGRPLTPVSDDPNDFEPLTPNHFLLGRPSPNLMASAEYDIRSAPRQKWKHVQSLVNQFWDRWSKEYLTTLTTRQKWFKTNTRPKGGDLVMLLEKNLVRGEWTLGRITRTFQGDDGDVRKVEVKTKNGLYIRPMTKIAMLELEPSN